MAREPHSLHLEGVMFIINQHELAAQLPHQEARVYSFNVKNNEKWAAYIHARDQLLAQIIFDKQKRP
jgi:hypothetical protein